MKEDQTTQKLKHDGGLQPAVEIKDGLRTVLTPGQRRRATALGEIGYSLMLMRRHAKKLGFVRTPFGQFIRALAALANRDPTAIFERLGVVELDPLAAGYPAAAARLATDLKLDARQVMVQSGLEFLARNGAPVAAAVAGRTIGARLPELDACEQAVEDELAALNPDLRAKWSSLKDDLRMALGKNGV